MDDLMDYNTVVRKSTGYWGRLLNESKEASESRGNEKTMDLEVDGNGNEMDTTLERNWMMTIDGNE